MPEPTTIASKVRGQVERRLRLAIWLQRLVERVAEEPTEQV
jgi:hypothetical protein